MKMRVTGQRVLDVSSGMPNVEASYTGIGTIKGAKLTDFGTAVITPRPNGSAFIQAKEVITIGGERTTATIHSLGHYTADGKLVNNGIIFFNTAEIPGKLAFLNNEIIVFRAVLDSQGNGVLRGWDWK